MSTERECLLVYGYKYEGELDYSITLRNIEIAAYGYSEDVCVLGVEVDSCSVYDTVIGIDTCPSTEVRLAVIEAKYEMKKEIADKLKRPRLWMVWNQY